MNGVISFRPGNRVGLKRMQVYAEALSVLRGIYGRPVTPDEIVDAARPKDHPLHSWFEWDIEKLARQALHAQAQNLVHQVNLCVTKPNGDVLTTRKWVSVPLETGDDDGVAKYGYEEIETILGGVDSRAALLSQAMQDAERWRERYDILDELGDIFAAIDKVKTKAKKRKRA